MLISRACLEFITMNFSCIHPETNDWSKACGLKMVDAKRSLDLIVYL